MLMEFILVLFCITSSAVESTITRPLYVFGHMANSVYDVDEFLKLGANAIEVDLQFNKESGLALEFHHGIPCDCFRICHRREHVVTLLRHLNKIATPGNELFQSNFTGVVWVNVDFSTTKWPASSGRDVATLLINYAFTTTNNLKFVFTAWQPSDWPFFPALRDELVRANREDIFSKIGVSIMDVKDAFFFTTRNLIPGLGSFNMWMGDGVTNCFEHIYPIDDVRTAARYRESTALISKVTRWTIDTRSNIREALRLRVDVILSNDVHDVRAVLAEEEFRRAYRLATHADDPFERIIGHGPYRVGCDRKKPLSGEKWCWKDTSERGEWCWTSTECSKDPSICDVEMRCV